MNASARAARVAAACLLALSFIVPMSLSTASADETAGSIIAVDVESATITLDDDTVFVLGPDLDPEGLEVGNEVLLTYDEGDNGSLIVTAIEITE
ncbi:DUF1344 domain-containing protein [Roseibium polysiphoniae]|uniref:DUF1344 domain-containing protein n=1 Tax=Roseibium polysiphoniae TaxID=2571221 RepID=A0ABR9C971_9HYPH|nr:DUF1344 domain-containing protein [Roseibium polysiphoniae]MBD8876133.1 DUF1344 domain-containing protein [Roseibium polysiphoniae]